jgi:hypothetical protein
MKMDTSNAQKAHKLMPQWYKISLIKMPIISLISGPAKQETLCPQCGVVLSQLYFCQTQQLHIPTTGYNIIAGGVSDFSSVMESIG